MTIEFSDSYLSANNIRERIEELEDDIETLEDDNEPSDEVSAERDAWAGLLQSMKDYGTDDVINDDDFEQHVREMAEDIEGVKDTFLVIDWEATTDAVRSDYTAFEIEDDGTIHTYLAR